MQVTHLCVCVHVSICAHDLQVSTSLCGGQERALGVLKLPSIPLRQGLSLSLGLPQLCLMPMWSSLSLLSWGHSAPRTRLAKLLLECTAPLVAGSPGLLSPSQPRLPCFELCVFGSLEPGSHIGAHAGFQSPDRWLRCLF